MRERWSDGAYESTGQSNQWARVNVVYLHELISSDHLIMQLRLDVKIEFSAFPAVCSLSAEYTLWYNLCMRVYYTASLWDHGERKHAKLPERAEKISVSF